VSLQKRFPTIFFRLFGTGAFLPIMETVRDLMGLRVFHYLGYIMFSYLFSW
jgi:hypothetical protein